MRENLQNAITLPTLVLFVILRSFPLGHRFRHIDGFTQDTTFTLPLLPFAPPLLYV